jgi:hypothetical protein
MLFEVEVDDAVYGVSSGVHRQCRATCWPEGGHGS